MITGVGLSPLTSTHPTGVGRTRDPCSRHTVSEGGTQCVCVCVCVSERERERVCVCVALYTRTVGYSSYFKWSEYLRQPGPIPAPAFMFTKVYTRTLRL